MKRSVPIRWALVFLACLLAVGWWGGCWSRLDPSITVTEPVPFFSLGAVENGSAFDRAEVELGGANKVVLPHDAVVRRTGEAGRVELFMKKTLAFRGHPPWESGMSIRGARRNMGCALKAEGGVVVIATYGEWDSIEGGAYMGLIAVVPAGVEVEQRKELSGPDSAGHSGDEKPSTESKGGYWYGPTSPAGGWTVVSSVPDRDRTAQELGRPNRPPSRSMRSTAKS